MNQRMIELYKEASEFAYKICREEGREGGTQDHIWNTLSTGKFAELIVEECVQTLINNMPERYTNESAEEDWDKGYDRAMKDCVHHILDHFGVKE